MSTLTINNVKMEIKTEMMKGKDNNLINESIISTNELFPINEDVNFQNLMSILFFNCHTEFVNNRYIDIENKNDTYTMYIENYEENTTIYFFIENDIVHIVIKLQNTKSKSFFISTNYTFFIPSNCKGYKILYN